MDQSNIVDYLDDNINNEQDVEALLGDMDQMPQSQPNFNERQHEQHMPSQHMQVQHMQAPQYQPQMPVQMPTQNVVQMPSQPMVQPTMDASISPETIKWIQNISDANQIPDAVIMSTCATPDREPSHYMIIQKRQFPLIMFQNAVIQQVKQRMMNANAMHAQAQQDRIPYDKVTHENVAQNVTQPVTQKIIDLSQKPEESEILTSHSRGVPEDEIKENESMIAPLFKNYNKSIMVFVLILIFMNTFMDEKVVTMVPFLNNGYAMLGIKAVILTILYHLLSAFLIK